MARLIYPVLSVLVTGFIVQFSGKYDYAFYLAGAIAIVSSLLVFVFVKVKDSKPMKVKAVFINKLVKLKPTGWIIPIRKKMKY